MTLWTQVDEKLLKASTSAFPYACETKIEEKKNIVSPEYRILIQYKWMFQYKWMLQLFYIQDFLRIYLQTTLSLLSAQLYIACYFDTKMNI